MTREDLIKAGERALPRYGAWTEMAALDVVDVVLDAIEPLIRADERDATIASLVPGLSAGAHAIGDLLTRQSLHDLRAQVEALRAFWRAPDIPMISRDEVLALFDGTGE